MTGGETYHLFDARPGKRFGGGHVPSAESAFPKDDDFLSKLPAEKDALLVFYCGGATCPYTGVAVKKAREAGYTNLKGFQAGLPGWKKAKLPVHSDASWLAKNLNTQHVVLDVRAKAESWGAEGRGGWMGRAERMILVLLGVGLEGLDLPTVEVTLWILVTLSGFTVAQRIRRTWQQLGA